MAKAQAQEPSMEEILASIRRIIADEETAPKSAKMPEPEVGSEDESVSEEDLDRLFASAGGDEPAAEEAAGDDDVLDLTEDLMVEDPPLVEGVGDDSDIAFEDPDSFLEPAVEPMPPATPVFEAPKPAPFVAAPAPQPLPSTQPVPAHELPPIAEAAPLISHATEGLVSSAFSDLGLAVLNRNAKTLEDLVQDMLRPMLKAWLDQNLPNMVDRLVRAEIERVTRGR